MVAYICQISSIYAKAFRLKHFGIMMGIIISVSGFQTFDFKCVYLQ